MKQILFIFFGLVVCLPIYGQEETAFDKACSVYFSKNYEEAITLFSEIIDSKDSSYLFQSYYMRGYCYHRLKKYSRVESDVFNALKIPKNFNLPSEREDANWLKGNSHWLYARSLEHLGEFEKSLSHLKKAQPFSCRI